ncbi:MAG: hypothetical protein MSH10_01180 [Pygmaiobacter massiliensis]|jgi:hypothetical protein|nr:hypothetical protein [Pygmaiobacter massiliensis]
MSFGAIAAFLVVLFVTFVWGNLWFHLVEAVIARVKRLLLGPKQPSTWHLLDEQEEKEN